MNMRLFSRILALSSFAFLVAAPANAQQPAQTPPQPKQQAQATKKARVWTDDNIDSLRSASDNYQMQQAQERAAQQASAQQAAAASKSPSEDERPIPQVKTTQEADQLIARDNQDIQSQQGYIQQTKKDLATAPDSYKPRLQWRIQSRTESIARLQDEVSGLEKEKAALAKSPAPPSGSSSSQPQSQ